jgi:hypothetical protein
MTKRNQSELEQADQQCRLALYAACQAALTRAAEVAGAHYHPSYLGGAPAQYQKDVWELLLGALRDDAVLNMNVKRLTAAEDSLERALNRN